MYLSIFNQERRVISVAGLTHLLKTSRLVAYSDVGTGLLEAFFTFDV